MKIVLKTLPLAMGVSLQILMMSSLHAEFDLDDVNLEAHKKHYNSLPAVEENDALLEASSQFAPFLKKAEEVVTRYELEDSIGLRLIHRHFNLAERQVMSENYEVITDVPSLVSYAHSIEEAQEKSSIPASWIFSGNADQEVLLFEASADTAVKAASLKLQKSPEFFDEMNTLLGTYKLTNLLSVAVLKRDLLEAKKGEIYMEVNSPSKEKSVVQIWDKKNKPPVSLRTSWSFNGPKQHGCIMSSYCQPMPHFSHLVRYNHQ